MKVVFHWKKLSFGFGIAGFFVALLVLGQQCARLPLELQKDTEFSQSSENPFQLDTPHDYPVIRRYVILVDMSNSMISGACPQDVDAGLLFSNPAPYQIYDPNKKAGDKFDNRGSGADCKASSQLPFLKSSIIDNHPDINAVTPSFYLTHLGIDHEGNRFKIVKKWINDVLKNSTPAALANIKIMLVPVSGGISQKKIETKLKSEVGIKSVYDLLSITDPKVQQILESLQVEHGRNLGLVQSDDIYRYETTTMGTTSPGATLKSIYDTMYADMRVLNKLGQLSFTEYNFTHLTDGIVNPMYDDFTRVLNFYTACKACASSLKTCAGVCSKAVQKMQTAWGDPAVNELNTMDFNFGLLQALPMYFGSGYLSINFIQLQKDRVLGAHPGEKTYFEKLQPLFQERRRKATIWQANTENPPYSLPGSSSNSVSFKLTHLYVLNPNVRLDKNGVLAVDSDGDGLFDYEEVIAGTDPLKARTNGYCLDSMLASPAFGARCKAMAQSKSCDPTLDSDGDSLNECEESLLGTDPFDFDTDGDSIPDSLEWIYDFNPLVSDEGKDGNGDGYPNLVNFATGLPPDISIEKIPDTYKAKYEVNYKGKGDFTDSLFGHVWVELHQLMIRYMPTLETKLINPEDQAPLYSSRLSIDNTVRDKNIIPVDKQLITYNTERYTNTLLALARIVDKDDPTRAYWLIYKAKVYTGQTIAQPQIDLSQFKMIRAMDRSE